MGFGAADAGRGGCSCSLTEQRRLTGHDRRRLRRVRKAFDAACEDAKALDQHLLENDIDRDRLDATLKELAKEYDRATVMPLALHIAQAPDRREVGAMLRKFKLPPFPR